MKNEVKTCEDLNKIIYSEIFRSLQNKTQLFYYEEGNHFRTRLTHSLEVEKIALNIANGLNEKLSSIGREDTLLDLTLVQAIALSHDIGHTPFGRIGERVIDEILSRKDPIGLLNKKHKNLIFFKHNINSARILKEMEVSTFEIIDGACKHTKIEKKNYDYGEKKEDPYELNKLYKGKYKTYALKSNAFTLEGQVVAIADEIAQRISDFDDILDNRHIERIKSFLPDIKKSY